MRRTPAQDEAIVEYVTTVQRVMGLDHWDIVIQHEEPGEDAEADTVLGETMVEHFGYRAMMRFKTDAIFGGERDEARRVVVHECVHLYLEHWALDVDMVARPIVSPTHAAALERSYERSIEAITWAIARHVPLPDWDEDVVS